MLLDVNIAGNIITTIGIYVFVTMLAWLERTIPRVMNLLDSGWGIVIEMGV